MTSFKSRDELCQDKIQQLNYYVKVTVIKDEDELFNIINTDEKLKVVIMTETMKEDISVLNNFNEMCRSKGVAFIMGNQNGLFG